MGGPVEAAKGAVAVAGGNLSCQPRSLAAGIGCDNPKFKGLAGVFKHPAPNLGGRPCRWWLAQAAGDGPGQQQHIIGEVENP